VLLPFGLRPHSSSTRDPLTPILSLTLVQRLGDSQHYEWALLILSGLTYSVSPVCHSKRVVFGLRPLRDTTKDPRTRARLHQRPAPPAARRHCSAIWVTFTLKRDTADGCSLADRYLDANLMRTQLVEQSTRST
jgi:hypothetical protein